MKKVRDHYFKEAKRDGYAARSAYKLEEIDRRHKLLGGGMTVLDLGCAPGSWLQVAAKRVGPSGRVVGVDLQEVTLKLPANVHTLQGDMEEIPPESLLPEGESFDVILSDMAPRTTGIKQADAARSAALVQRVFLVAEELLKPGGHLLVKVFQGGEMPHLRTEMKRHFKSVTVEKPKASRSESVEIFLLGKHHIPHAS